jgi:hypothetical protein
VGGVQHGYNLSSWKGYSRHKEVCDPLGPDRAEKALEGLDDGKTTRQSNPARCAKFEWTAVPDRAIVKPW